MEIYGVDLWCHIHDVTHRVHALLSQHWSGLKDEPVECTISRKPFCDEATSGEYHHRVPLELYFFVSSKFKVRSDLSKLLQHYSCRL